MNTIEFTETQKLKRKRTYAIPISLIISFAMLAYAGIQQDSAFLLASACMLTMSGIPIAFQYFTEFQTKVNEEGVFFRCIRLSKYTAVNWALIEKAEIVKVGFVGYGTWSKSLGTVYNVAADTALSLIMKSGKKLVIGTQKPEELIEFLTGIDKFH